jgi:mono/diheme cytochrome c family protein
MKRAVQIVQGIAVVAAFVFVVALFLNPEKRVSSSAPGATYDGGVIFEANCQACHGAAGRGGSGPQLSGGRAVRDFPTVADEVAFVTHGSGAMPAWGGRLNEGEIAAVVAYTRTL